MEAFLMILNDKLMVYLGIKLMSHIDDRSVQGIHKVI